MARRASQQSTFTKGELDPDLSERGDLEAYHDSLAKAPNSVFHPQGGFSDRGGFELCADAEVLASGVVRRLRNRIVPLDVTADNLSAPNGGITSRLVDQDASTVFVTNAVTSTPFVVLEIDLGSVRRVDFVDIEGFWAELAGADECLAVEYYTGTWVTFGDAIGVPVAKHIRQSERTRRFGVTPGGPGGVPVQARQWRVVARSGGGAIGQISIRGLKLWAETSALCPTFAREVARDTATTYQVVVGERNVDIFTEQRYLASVPLPAAGQQVQDLWFTGGFDTMFVFHDMIQSQRIVRQGSASEWNIDPIPLENVPTLADSVVFSGNQDEIQDVSLAGLTGGQSFVLFVGSQMTRPITIGLASALAGQIKTALQTLPGIANGGGDMTTDLVDAAALTVRVRFAGNNGNRAWPLVAPVALSGVDLPDTVVVQAGLDADGAYMSATTGWPTCGIITQQRLMVAGFRAAPTSYRFSTNPNYYNFNSQSDPMTADLGFGGALDAKNVERIVALFAGTHLTMFTHVREYFTLADKLDATAPASFRTSTANGIQRGVPMQTVDGATLFVQEGGNTLREFRYSDTEQGYGAEPLTVLSPQIMSGVVDIACRQARRVQDGNQLFLVNENGTAGVLTLLRSQKVVAGSPWHTYGAFRSVMTSVTHDVYAVTERDGYHWLERWTPDIPLDWATRSVGAPRTEIDGAGYLAGRSDVWVIADDDLIGPVEVTGDTIVLDEPAEDVRFGLLPEWFARSQELRERLANSQPFRGPARIYEIQIAVKETGQLMVGTNGASHQDVPLLRVGASHKHGGPLQTENGGDPSLPMYERLYTGNVLLTGLLGVADHPYWELSRTVPAPVHVKSVRIEVAHRGDPQGGG